MRFDRKVFQILYADHKVATPVFSLNESFQKFNVKVAIILRDNQCQLCLTNYSVVYTAPRTNFTNVVIVWRTAQAATRCNEYFQNPLSWPPLCWW